MKKPATVTDWRNRARSVANNDLEKKAELHAALEKFIRTHGEWLVSPPSVRPARVECMHGSILPNKLAELGWQVRHLGTNTRILPGAVIESYIDHATPGKPVLVRCHAGPIEVAVNELKP
jgi:hypothetical protein